MGLVLRGNMSLFLRLDVLIKHLGKDQLALERAGAYNIGFFFFFWHRHDNSRGLPERT